MVCAIAADVAMFGCVGGADIDADAATRPGFSMSGFNKATLRFFPKLVSPSDVDG